MMMFLIQDPQWLETYPINVCIFTYATLNELDNRLIECIDTLKDETVNFRINIYTLFHQQISKRNHEKDLSTMCLLPKQHILLPPHMAILWCFVIALNTNTRTWSSSHLLGMRSPRSYLTLLNSIFFIHKRYKMWWDRENLLGIVECNPNTRDRFYIRHQCVYSMPLGWGTASTEEVD